MNIYQITFDVRLGVVTFISDKLFFSSVSADRYLNFVVKILLTHAYVLNTQLFAAVFLILEEDHKFFYINMFFLVEKKKKIITLF